MIIQVIGPNGMLGSEVSASVVRSGLFVYNCHTRLENIVPSDITGDVVINCAGLVKQLHEKDSSFIRTNSLGPHILAEACDMAGSRLIHISTDCVFNRNGPHFENDIPNGFGVYAISKIAGEITRVPHLTIRTSFIGRGKRGLVRDIINGSVKASSRFFWSGHTVKTIADIVVQIAMRDDITGLLHIPGEFQTRLDLAYHICNRLELSTDRVIRDDSFVADRRLVSGKWTSFKLPILPSFRKQMKEL